MTVNIKDRYGASVPFSYETQVFSELIEVHAIDVTSLNFPSMHKKAENFIPLKEKALKKQVTHLTPFVVGTLAALALLAGGIALCVFSFYASHLAFIMVVFSLGFLVAFISAHCALNGIQALIEMISNFKTLANCEHELNCVRKNQEFFAPKHPIFEEVMAKNRTLENRSFEPTQEIKLLQEAANADKDEEKEEIFQELFHGYTFRTPLLPPEIVKHINQFSKENQ